VAASAPNLDIANGQQSPAVPRSRGKKTQAHSKPCLLQTYRCNMGGGNFVLMNDLSSPIFVRGRHWGAFRMGFRRS